MSFPIRAGAALATLILLSGCGPRDDKYNPTHFTVVGPVAPPDVRLPATIKAGQTFGGIHPSSDVATICCMADARLDLPVAKSTAAAELHLYVYLSPAQASSRFTVTFPDGISELTKPLKKGFASGTVPVPLSLRAVTGIVRLRIASPAGPFTLLSVYFE